MRLGRWRRRLARALHPEPEGAAARAGEYAAKLLGSAIAFWLLAVLFRSLFGTALAYTWAGFGLLFSVQATYYKHRLDRDPSYEIRGCGCGGTVRDDTEVVLRSHESTVLGVPNSALGIAFYPALALLLYGGDLTAATLLGILALAASAWLAWVLVARIGRLCTICVHLASLNVLLLWKLLG